MLMIRDTQMNALADASPGQRTVIPCKPTWIEVRLIDQNRNYVPGERYRITLPDSSVREGALDQDGRVRIEGIVAGQCRITFPDRDSREWEPA